LLQVELLFENGDQEINGDGDPNLDLNAVGRSTEEAFDAQVLLDPFEEELDLPSAAINLSNGQRRQKEVVCEEDESFVDVQGVIADATQWGRITLRRDGTG
jgi:hypothetical protein